MRAITICMLVALTVNGTTLWAQKPGKAAKPGMANEPGLVKTTTWDWKEPEVSSVVEGVGTLGILVRPLDPRLRYWAGLPEGIGIWVRHVEDSSPAEQAGLKFGDYIVKIDDQWVSNTYQYKALIRHLGPGHKVTILVRRSSKTTSIGNVTLDPPRMEAKDYIFEAILGETDGAPLVDPLEPMDWSKPPKKETVRHKGLTFNFRDHRMVQAINAEGVIRYQGRDGVDWAKYLPKEEFPFAEMPHGVGGVNKLVGVPEILSVEYEAVGEKPKNDKPDQAHEKKP